MPTQVSAALGAILRMPEAKDKPCGAYGSFGWSGEAVDILDSRLRNAGCIMAFKCIRCQFRPDAKMLQVLLCLLEVILLILIIGDLIG